MKEQVAKKYLSFLEKGEIDRVVDLFTDDGLVISPLYGTRPAKDFYKALAADTTESILTFDGLFFEKQSNRISLLFDYDWKLKTGENVQFKVVDIIELNSENKIEKLTIIYDTVHSRDVLKELRKVQ
ncbi:nuclear transport factor 2 family protein [Aquimarina sp. AD10]|uniref:nuclear transport factor 2 family protein n=1 Tax=Aquimarina sp. AD10 TaxID=1714849 RepID=UPI000E4D64A8|nr:nuclear transport factor 2 family protein [Aquimarina sp. AD10]AXT59859.1 nuclear transport factor 2 family protein [Aquimarina sp. AD10]RKN00224.1 nuclear transport factor 2 family protein [Aquimarina sp. AD10]